MIQISRVESFVLFFILICGAGLSGCTSMRTVRPTELPKLNNSQSTTTARGNVAFVLQTARHVQAPDGRIIQVVGPFHLHVVTKRGKVVKFAHPVSTRLSGDSLEMRGGNRGLTVFRVRDLKSTKVEVNDPGKTILLIAGINLGVLAIGGVIVGVIAANSSSSIP